MSFEIVRQNVTSQFFTWKIEIIVCNDYFMEPFGKIFVEGANNNEADCV